MTQISQKSAFALKHSVQQKIDAGLRALPDRALADKTKVLAEANGLDIIGGYAGPSPAHFPCDERIAENSGKEGPR